MFIIIVGMSYKRYTKNNPLLSIVTVCLNAGNDLDETVKSVLGQTYTEFEYIIKDGGSTDGSLNRVPSDDRIKIIRQDDDGIFDAMNQALKIANGKFVNFLNAGDAYYDKEVLQAVKNTYLRNKDVQFFYGNFYKHNSRSKYITPPKRLNKFYLFTHSLCHQAWFLSRKKQQKNGGYSTATRIGGDYLMLLDMVLKEKVNTKKIDKFLIEYKGGGVSASPENKIKSQKIRNKKRKELYTSFEYYFYTVIWKFRNWLKNIFYDKYFYIIVKKFKEYKFKSK